MTGPHKMPIQSVPPPVNMNTKFADICFAFFFFRLPGMIQDFSNSSLGNLTVQVEEEVQLYKKNEGEYWLVKVRLHTSVNRSTISDKNC